MKKLLFACAFAALGLGWAAPAGVAQESAGVKVTTILHNDGTRTDIQKDFDSHTEETRTYDTAQRLIKRSSFTLDDQGRELEGVIYNAKGAVLSRVNYSYDPVGRLKEQIDRNPAGQVVRKTVFRHDFQGQIIGADVFDAQGRQLLSGSASDPRAGKSRSR